MEIINELMQSLIRIFDTIFYQMQKLLHLNLKTNNMIMLYLLIVIVSIVLIVCEAKSKIDTKGFISFACFILIIVSIFNLVGAL